MNKIRTYIRRRQFIKAYRILRNKKERHEKEGHNVEFGAAGSYIKFHCVNCTTPDL